MKFGQVRNSGREVVVDQEITTTPWLQPGPIVNATREECGWWVVFAVLLGIISWRHEMYVDETQAWLLARDSRTWLQMLGRLRYEGHPGLWYTLLYLPAHLGWSPVTMQVIAFALALVMAALVLTERRIELHIRVLSTFSVAIFFYMGIMARSYIIAGVLLFGAARLLIAPERPRHWLAVLLLGLAINTHFFAIPVALALLVWGYALAPGRQRPLLLTGRLWGTVAAIGVSLALCFFTVRPAADIYTPHYERAGLSPMGYLILSVGRVWDYFTPFPLGALSVAKREVVGPWQHPSLIAAGITLVLWAVAISVLSSRRGRWFFVAVSLTWTVAVWATVHVPGPFHSSFLVLAFVIALCFDGADQEQRPWLGTAAARTVLTVLLAMQLPITAHYWLEEFFLPFSGAKATADWLVTAGLQHRPLIIAADIAAPSILAYDNIPAAYFPTCHCRGSFTVYRAGRDDKNQVSSSEIESIRRQFGVAPVILSYYEVPEETLTTAKMKLAYTSPKGAFWQFEDLHVYIANDSADSGTVLAKNGGE